MLKCLHRGSQRKIDLASDKSAYTHFWNSKFKCSLEAQLAEKSRSGCMSMLYSAFVEELWCNRPLAYESRQRRMARDTHQSSGQDRRPESEHPLPWSSRKARMWPTLITARLNLARCASCWSSNISGHTLLSQKLLFLSLLSLHVWDSVIDSMYYTYTPYKLMFAVHCRAPLLSPSNLPFTDANVGEDLQRSHAQQANADGPESAAHRHRVSGYCNVTFELPKKTAGCRCTWLLG